MEEALTSSLLPIDLLLEIAARSDPVTLVRCAATCKVLRRHVADPAFLRPDCLRLRHAGGDGGRCFVPTLLRGFFYQPRHRREGEDPLFMDPGRRDGASPEPFRSFLSEYADLFEFYEPMAASGGLVALRCSSSSSPEGPPTGVGVCNPMTGYLDLFHPPGISAQSYALLTGDDRDDDGQFRLLASNLTAERRRLQTQAYSSGTWKAVAEAPVPCPRDATLLRPSPLVLDGIVYWLYKSDQYCYFVLSLAAGHVQPRAPATAASVIKIVPEDDRCGEQLRGCRPEELLLVSSPVDPGRPALLVASGLEISVWTMPPSSDPGGRWAKQVVVAAERVLRQCTPAKSGGGRLELRWFGERSGAVFVRMAGAAAAEEEESSWSSYFVVDLGMKRIRKVCMASHGDVHVFFPYEMDLSFWRPWFTPKYMV